MDFAWMYHPMMVVGEISHKGRKSDPGVLWGPPERVRVSETCRLFTHSLAAPEPRSLKWGLLCWGCCAGITLSAFRPCFLFNLCGETWFCLFLLLEVVCLLDTRLPTTSLFLSCFRGHLSSFPYAFSLPLILFLCSEKNTGAYVEEWPRKFRVVFPSHHL